MTRKVLDHFGSYEWRGSFWLPGAGDNQFSGKVTYNPETGIRVELLTTKLNTADKLIKKILHGVVTGEVTAPITLLNVSLELATMQFGQANVKLLTGRAGYLLQGFLLTELLFNSIEIQYEEQFENIFFRSAIKGIDILAYAESKISPESDIEISMSLDSHGTGIYTPNEIDTIFWSHNEEKFKEFKDSLTTFIEDPSFELYRRNHLAPTFKIETLNSEVQDLFSTEEKWRSFWELMVDRDLLPSKVWLKVPYSDEGEETVHTVMLPLLKNHFRSIKRAQKRAPLDIILLPINITSFGDTENDLSIVEEALKKWFYFKKDLSWAPVVHGITRMLNNKYRLPETSQYASLVSEIETFLNLTNQPPENIDTLIDRYADDTWKMELTKILSLQKEETLGKFITDIRNAIVHPKGADKRYKRHLEIIRDIEMFPKVYAYLAGLFIKAILQELGSISIDSIQKYTKNFIAVRGSFQIMKYT